MGQAVIQMGESIYATITNLGRIVNRYGQQTSIMDIIINGNGNMFDSTNQFVRISADSDLSNITFLGAWNHCWKQNEVFILPDGITSIANGCFQLDEDIQIGNNINEFILGSDVRTIGNSAFEQSHYVSTQHNYSETGFRSFVIKNPQGLESIGNRAFFNNLNLANIDFGGYSPVLGSQVFQECSSLTSTNFGKNMRMPYGTFYNCKKLTKFNEDNSINYFENNTNLSYQYPCMGNCNYIEELSFTEDCMFKQFFKFDDHSFFFVEKFAGSNCNENGDQITTITGLSTWAICHPWLRLENRATIMDSGRPFIVLKHKGKAAIVPCYPKPAEDNTDRWYFLRHKGRTWYILSNTKAPYKVSPLIVREPKGGIYFASDEK